MASIRPFAGIRYARGADVSSLIAPPYDVLSEQGKAALQARHPNNIVTVDLPHLPPKTVGPDETYGGANSVLQAWIRAGVLKQDRRPAFYPYAQNYQHGGLTHHRRGFFALVKLSPFGEGHVVPHEKTYASAIEDRLKLTRATGTLLSPIFGLFSDAKHEVTNLLYHNLGKPEQAGTLDGVQNDLWSVTDSDVENGVIDLMGHKPIYIADGHHRYTMALQYKKEAEAAAGGHLPPNHPANYCLFVLVGMQDPGLIILPTHRLIGGLQNFQIEAFKAAVAPNFQIEEMAVGPDRMDEAVNALAHGTPHSFGLYDGKSRRLYSLKLTNLDVLKPLEANHSEAWRRLDVAILQRYLLDEVLQPKFAGGGEMTKGYTAYANEVAPQVDGSKYQIALLLRPTPLHALEELGKHNEVMPQKSTFFFPKLATGMVMYSVR
ncbi:MAG TPA: DUF1015 domain-containing protein [Tepidisphaeraceae bacterium]|nr:DUF1015 domain-containing protein [Tepidisphaeraceae bacterium]